MEKAPIRSSALRPYSVTEPKAVVFEAMASRINAKMSVGKTDILFTILIMQLEERNSFWLLAIWCGFVR